MAILAPSPEETAVDESLRQAPGSHALVYLTGSLGDCLVSIPALRAIRRAVGASSTIWILHEQRPEVVTPSAVLPAGLADRYLAYPYGEGVFSNSCAAVRLWARLRRLQFDKVFYLVGSKRDRRSVTRDALFFSLCGIRSRVGFHAFPAETVFPRDPAGCPAPAIHEARARLDRLALDGIDISSERSFDPPLFPIPSAEREHALRWLDSERRHRDRRLVAICPGTNMPSKQWPVERFAEFGAQMVSAGDIEPVVVGGDKDRPIAEFLIAKWGVGLNATGKFSVTGSAALLSYCDFCFTLDSGPMHLAAAVGVRCIAIFSARDYPGRWDPLGRGHIVIRRSIECGGCMTHACPRPDHPCMNDIEVPEALAAIDALRCPAQ